MLEDLTLIKKLDQAADLRFREVDDLSRLEFQLRGEKVKHHLGPSFDLLWVSWLDITILGTRRFIVLRNDDDLLATNAIILAL